MLTVVSVAEHWDSVYRNKADDELSWMRSDASRSLRLIGPPPNSDAAIVDVGAGTSTLVDHLVDDQWPHITLLDLSAAALEATCCRLADRCADIELVTGTILDWQPQRPYDVWHDRAVAHFLLDEADQSRYRDTLLAATHPGSFVIIGVFGPDGPPMCAGLPARRFTEADVASLLGDKFEILHTEISDHVRPDGDTQQYVWTLAQRRR